jgi:putative redox protein
MIRVESLSAAYQGVVRNRTHQLTSDAPIAKGGGGNGFGAHELLEASLAVCINMATRMHAAQNDIPLVAVSTSVALSWPDEHTSRFEYTLELSGALTAEQRTELERVADQCPVRQTLSKRLAFERLPQEVA